MELLQTALDGADPDVQTYIESDIACCALASGSVERAAPHAHRALTLALGARHPVLAVLAIAYCAPAHALIDARQGARLFGFARARLPPCREIAPCRKQGQCAGIESTI